MSEKNLRSWDGLLLAGCAAVALIDDGESMQPIRVDAPVQALPAPRMRNGR